MARRLVTVFGGSGFIGRHLVRRLAGEGWIVRVAVRDPEGAQFLIPLGHIGQIVPVAADIGREETVRAAVRDAEAVVNLVGILYERRRGGFRHVHVDGARAVATAAQQAGAASLVHISALGADPASESVYARTKAEGEQAVRASFPAATIFRPSVVFGPEDGFFNRFAKMARVSPALPVVSGDALRLRKVDGRYTFDLYGSGGPRFQPVYVGDVADAIMECLRSPARAGHTYELGGPRIYSMKEVMELVLRVTERRRLLMPVPLPLAYLEALFLQLLPNPVLTTDQVRLLKKDNVVSGNLPGLEQLGIMPTAAEVIVPTYLSRHRPIESQSTSTRQPPQP